MEEQTERKAAVTVPEEPIKAEGAVGSPGTSERSDGSSSPPPNCSICLGKLVNTSFTDSCLHQFCFTCLLQWSKIKTECPLCKQTFKSIIHNVRSEEDYDQYHVPRELASQVAAATLDVNFDIVGGVGTVGVGSIGGNWDIGVRRFMYRSTMGNPGRRFGMVINPHEVARREQIPSIAPQLSRDERRRRQINPSDFRRNVYRHGVWASPLPDFFGGFRECSAEFYRRHPGEVSRLVPWLNRELQVLLNNNAPHVAYVMRVITDALSRYDIRTAEFRNLVRPYFGIHTEHFVHELVNFARTNYDMVGYDQSVIYLPSRGLSNEYVPRILSSPVSSSSSMTSDDSDVRVVDEPVGRREINIRLSAVVPQSIDMPGPSTVGRAFHPYTPYNIVPDIVTVSSSSSGSEDECEVVGYVKPRHERTPEIIDLSNSESEVVIPQAQPAETAKPPIVSTIEDESQPSTSHEVKRQAVRKVENVYPIRMLEILSSSSYSESDSDSDYSPKRKHKVSSKKSKKLSQNPPPTRKRKRSTVTKSRRVKSPSERMKLTTSSIIYSSSDSDSKHPKKRAPKKETTKRRRISVSTTDSSSEKSKSPTTTTTTTTTTTKSKSTEKKSSKKRNTNKSESRKMKKHSLSSAAPKENSSSKTLKRENNIAANIYTESEEAAYSSCEDESDSGEKEPRVERKSRRRRSYSTSSSNCSSTARSQSSSSSSSSSSSASLSSKTKEKSRESRRRSSNKSGTRNSRLKKSEVRSASNNSSCSYDGSTAGIIDRSKSPEYPSCSDCSDRAASSSSSSRKKRDLSTSDRTRATTTTTTTTTTESGDMMDKMLGYEETRSSTDPSVLDLEQHRYYRSRSQCSVCSDNTSSTRVSSKKKSKHKDKRKEKMKKTLSSSSAAASKLFFSSSDGNSSMSLSNVSSSSSSKNDAPSTSKHSDSTKSSSSSSRSRDKHRSHKKSKDSRRRRSRSNSRSKSKKKSTRQVVIDFKYD